MFKVDRLSPRAIDNLVYGNSPSFSGIIAGECKGEIWVDDICNPSLALVFSFAVGGYSILGSLPIQKSTRNSIPLLLGIYYRDCKV